MAKKIKKRKKIIKKKSNNFFPRVVILSFFILLSSFLLISGNLKFSNLSTKNHQKNPQHINKIIQPQIISNGSRNNKEIALTFDADMTTGMMGMLDRGVIKSWYNKPIIDYLEKNNIEATIFFTGLWVKTYPNEARNIANNPLFEIGNHSYSHKAFTKNCFNLPQISDKEDYGEIENAQEIITKETGIKPDYFRFPGGCADENDLNIVSTLGLKTVHWDVVSGDALNQNTESIVNNVEKRVQNGSIVVMHLNGGAYAPKTYFALIQIIPELEKKGFKFVKVSDILEKN